MSKIGPDGTFPLGGPIAPSDRGRIGAGWRIHRDIRAASLDFGSIVTWICATPENMDQLTRTINHDIITAFGEVRFDPAELPIKVVNNRAKGVIEWEFPQPLSTLMMNAEGWLALTHETRRRINVMRN